MTKKHFEAIARSFAAEAKVCDPTHLYTLRMVASSIAAECAADNPRFDRERFMEACGVR